MTLNFTTDNIDQLRAVAMVSPAGWKVTFRSTNAGMYHQLYVNRQLKDWTDTAEQRSFVLDPSNSRREIIIAAVDADNRRTDLSGLLLEAAGEEQWVYRALVKRSVGAGKGSRLALLTDHATGVMDEKPLGTWDLWRGGWAWGEDEFGRGGLGFDGALGVGLGRGAFGVGMLGIEEDVLAIQSPLAEEGTHQLVLRTIASDGQHTDSQPQAFCAYPPPPAPAGLEVTAYDEALQRLTVQIQKG